MADELIRTNLGEQAERMLARLRGIEDSIARATKATLTAHGERWRKEMQDRFQPWTRGFRHSGDSAIRIRSGGTRRSISAKVTGDAIEDLVLTESAGGTEAAPGARLQELGGTVTPKKGQWLAIPMDQALTASGQPKRGFESPRNVPGLFFFQSNRDVVMNRAWLVRRSDFERKGPTRQHYLESEGQRSVAGARGAKLEFLYMLLKSVTIPPRLGMRVTEQRLAPSRVNEFWSQVRRELSSVGGA